MRRCTSRSILAALILGLGSATPGFADDAAALIGKDLARCAAISSRDERLACYDALAANHGATANAPAGAPAPTAAAAPPAAAVPPAASVPPKKEDFGLSAAQLQKVNPQKQIESISAKVTSVWHSGSGHMLLELDNGQSWQLDSEDPLLAAGNTVTIQRGALGSFLLTTPTRRTHHAHRMH